MLPGFRFLFGAIVLSVSLLIFGLGATALLRVAHQEFTSLPSRPAPPPPVFAAQGDPAMPSLAMLRDDSRAMDNQAAEETPPGDAQAAAEPAEPSTNTPAAVSPSEPEKIATPVVAAPALEESPRLEMPDTQTLASETTAPSEPTTTAEATSPTETPAASISTALAAAGAAPTASEQIEMGTTKDSISTKIATLSGPAVEAETKASAAKMRAKSRAVAIKKRVLKERRAAKNRITKRTRVVRRASQAPTAADPFGAQPFIGLPQAQ